MTRRAPSSPPEIDGYLVDRLIGSGGFSDVFLYEQQLPHRKVAVKVLLSHELTPSARAAFTTEADLMARLSTHPYIVTIYQAGVARDGRPYLVMEYCSRPSLAERYKKQPLSVVDALRTGVRLAGAVATAHAAGVLHRDIKPANVLTNDYGWPALTDFGIASDFADGADGLPSPSPADRGDAEASIGMSVPWSPPEMFADVPTPDVRSDIFSLAATIHTVLAGRTPFEVPDGPNGTVDLIARIERGEVTPLQRDDVPPTLAAVLAKAMSPRRENRYPTVVEFARGLQRVELELGYAPTTIDLPMDEEVPVAHIGGDETRLRAVPEVVAQPVAPERAPSLAPIPTAGPTARPIPNSTENPTPSATPDPEPDGESRQTASRRRILLTVLIAVLAVLAIAAVVLAVLIGGHGVLSSPTASPDASGGSAVVGPSVPQPADGTAVPSADGTTVAFTWTNPKPENGDVYYWARAETPSDRQATHQGSATVTGVVPGSRVCVNVEIGRSGATGDPLAICTG